MIAGGFLFSHGGADNGILLNLLFYIIITPVISLTLTKLMFMSENGMIVQDAITRIDSVLQSPPLSQPNAPQHPKDSSVTLDHVTFSYDGAKNALEDVSLSIGAGQKRRRLSAPPAAANPRWRRWLRASLTRRAAVSPSAA